jgi:hypothetical protein
MSNLGEFHSGGEVPHWIVVPSKKNKNKMKKKSWRKKNKKKRKKFFFYSFSDIIRVKSRRMIWIEFVVPVEEIKTVCTIFFYND